MLHTTCPFKELGFEIETNYKRQQRLRLGSIWNMANDSIKTQHAINCHGLRALQGKDPQWSGALTRLV